MSLFPILALPLFFLVFVTLVFRVTGPVLPFLKMYLMGTLIALPLIFIYIILHKNLPVSYTFNRLFVRYILTDEGFYFILGIIALFILKLTGFQPLSGNPDTGPSAFFFGLYTTVTVMEMVFFAGRYNYYLLFLAPFLRVCFSYVGGICAYHIFDDFDYKRYVFGIVALTIPVLGALIPAFAGINVVYAAIILTGIYAGFGLFLAVILQGSFGSGKYRPS